METPEHYQVVEAEGGIRRLNLRDVVSGKRQVSPELRAAFLSGAYALAAHLGLTSLPAELFRQGTDGGDA